MPRALRHQYAGAVYHVMARGDGGKAIFENDEDSKAFLFRLGQVCASHGWRVHAWVLMKNHFHLLLKTQEPNLVTGMKYLLGTFSQGWNARRARRGHVFQGRYKSVPVSAALDSPNYFRIVADYIHLNPARAGLVGKKRGKLVSYTWSSLQDYARGKGPDWLEMERLLKAFELAENGRDRRAYVSWLEARAENDGGKVDDVAMKALMRGWYLGEPSFGDKLRSLISPEKLRARGRDAVAKFHDEAAAEELVNRVLEAVGLPKDRRELVNIRKGDERKVLVATIARKHTSVSNSWLAERLEMGHTGSVSRVIGVSTRNKEKLRKVNEIEKMLRCDT